MKYEDMLKLAEEVSHNAYAPYSKFPVGACVLAESGKVYTGCNFENSSYGMTICAERNAVGTAIANGEKKIRAVAIYSPRMKNCMPCGACREFMTQLMPGTYGNIEIMLDYDNHKIVTLSELTPEWWI